jgi:outer membrane immunogenic protein
MRKALLAATALVSTVMFLVPGAVLAQSSRWSGPYVGVTAGIVYSDAPVGYDNFEDESFAAGRTPVYARGALLGLTAGYNVETAGVVVGIEGDASWSNLHGERSAEGASFAANLDSLLTLRGRLGFSSGNALIYGTAGVAGGQADYSATLANITANPDNVVPAAASGFVGGIVGGVGVEYALTDNMSIKTEGLMYELAPLSGVGDTGKGAFDSEYKPSGVAVRTGLNISF